MVLPKAQVSRQKCQPEAKPPDVRTPIPQVETPRPYLALALDSMLGTVGGSCRSHAMGFAGLVPSAGQRSTEAGAGGRRAFLWAGRHNVSWLLPVC